MIVTFAHVAGARYYLKRTWRSHRKTPELELVYEREDATKFEDDEAKLVASAFGGQAKPIDWMPAIAADIPKKEAKQLLLIGGSELTPEES